MNSYAWSTATVHTVDQQRAAQQLRDWELTTDATTHGTGAAARLAQLRAMCAAALAGLRGGPHSASESTSRPAAAR